MKLIEIKKVQKNAQKMRISRHKKLIALGSTCLLVMAKKNIIIHLICNSSEENLMNIKFIIIKLR